MTSNPTNRHPNCRRHNWLVYRNFDRNLATCTDAIRGVVLDAGCGTSPYRDFLLRFADRYIGVDWGSTQHQARPDVVADLNVGLPIDSQSVDTVFCISVLEHLHAPHVAITEFARVLRPGGSLILQVPWQWHLHEVPHDYFRFTPFALRRMLADAGFSEIEISSQGGCFSMLCLKLNYLSLRVIRGPAAVRSILTWLLWPFWYVGQSLAPVLDRLDRNWAAETGGYFVIAHRHGA